MTDFLLGLFVAFPTAFLLSLVALYAYLKCRESSLADDVTIMREDLTNLIVKLSNTH